MMNFTNFIKCNFNDIRLHTHILWLVNIIHDTSCCILWGREGSKPWKICQNLVIKRSFPTNLRLTNSVFSKQRTRIQVICINQFLIKITYCVYGLTILQAFVGLGRKLLLPKALKKFALMEVYPADPEWRLHSKNSLFKEWFFWFVFPQILFCSAVSIGNTCVGDGSLQKCAKRTRRQVCFFHPSILDWLLYSPEI